MKDQKELVENILKYWQETNSYQRSVDERSEKMSFRFYDGPPFASGEPHYGHLLSSSIKDLIPRFMTMCGYKVNRRWGWDCHGLPVENKVEKQLGISSKKEIEEDIGIEKFTNECRNYVLSVNDDWYRFINHLGRWVDIDNAYFTMDKNFMESVVWVFSDLYKKNLIFNGFKIQGYCPSCATTLSGHEINEGYAQKQDQAVTVKMPIYSENDEKHLQTSEGMGEIVAGVIKNSEGKYLLIHHQKEDLWVFPGGKVESDETMEKALDREIKEETGVEISNKSYLGAIKIIHHGKPYRVNYFEIQVDGTPQIMESEKHSDMQWAEKVEMDNEVGFGLKVDGKTIEEEQSLTRDFIDFYIFEKVFPQFQDNMEDLANGTFNFLAWTTTPWTLPSNMFLAVGEDIDYVIIFDKKDKQYFVLAKELLSKYYKNSDDYVFIFSLKGEELIGLSYTPIFDFYHKDENIEQEFKDNVHTVIKGDFVSTEEGTGLVHIAPAFGEDDYNAVLGYKGIFNKDNVNDWIFMPIDEYGNFTENTGKYSGKWLFDANKEIVNDLKQENKIVKIETVSHSYPFCRRCDTPLMYRAINSRFVDETSKKEEIIKNSESLKFIPESIKNRFVNILESAPDWNISRNRYWGAPIPVWECVGVQSSKFKVESNGGGCDNRKVLGSIKEMEDLSGQKVDDLHRPHIDNVTFKCEKCNGEMKRVPDVMDCWFESGSMPYGEVHYPFENENFNYPADFIAEGLDQTRGWFRALHVLGTLIMGQKSYKNVVVNGMILGDDGRKLSKKLKNFPDPGYLLDNYGPDAFRLFMLSSPLVRAEPARFSEDGVDQVLKDFTIPLQNVYNFFQTYADIDNYSFSGTEVFFMRHGEAESQDTDADLTEKGKQDFYSQEFIEKVIRTNPDVIYTSKIPRAKQSAEIVKEIIKEYNGKDIEIKVEEKLWEEHTEEIQETYDHIMSDEKGKNVLILAHKLTFRALWGKIYGMSYDDIKANKGYDLKNLEIIKIPSFAIHNELDKWILAELYSTVGKVEKSLKEYFIDDAGKELLSFMDKLTNWYLRRSRRRFWAGGMDEDKLSAFNTLFEVLKLYLKVAAPFAPFITEDIWQKLQNYQKGGSKDSIHLEFFPIYSDKYIDENLMKEIQTVRNIIKSALYVRSKNKIKVKQPLNKLEVKL